MKVGSGRPTKPASKQEKVQHGGCYQIPGGQSRNMQVKETNCVASCSISHFRLDNDFFFLMLELKSCKRKEGRKEMFYLTTHSTHFIYGYMASDIWLRTILIVRKETRCRHIGYSFRLAVRVLLYALSHRQDSTCHGLCYHSRGALAGTRTQVKETNCVASCSISHFSLDNDFFFF